MSIVASRTVRRGTVRFLDGLLAVWVLAWVGIGIWVAVDVAHLGRLADTLGTAASGLGSVSHGLAQLAKLPFVGAALAKLAADGSRTAASAATSATTARSSVDQLAYLLGVVIVVIPSVPALAVYLPFRIGRIRERRAVAAALADPDDPLAARRWLANRAVANLPYADLVRITPHPWDDLERGELDALAGAELARLGFHRGALHARVPGSTHPVRSSR